MATSHSYLPARLQGVRRRFEEWRRSRKGLSRVPAPLWAAAVKMAGIFGVSRTAQALGVNYNALRKRMERQAAVGPTESREIADTGFLELMPPTRAGSCQCMLELENASGATMRVHFRGAEVPDLAGIVRSFRDDEP
jgi:hypothetical protein